MTVFPGLVVCEEPDAADPHAVCGAQAVADRRCLAHLDADRRSAYLATLAPGPDVGAGGVIFTAELLAALRDDQNIVRVGKANFYGAIFSSRNAVFVEVKFSGPADSSPTPKGRCC